METERPLIDIPEYDKQERQKPAGVHATVRKKSAVRKAAGNVVSEDMGNVFNYLIFDLLIPAAKETILEMIQNGAEMLIRGEVSGRRSGSRRSSNRPRPSRTSYDDYYDDDRPRRKEQRRDYSGYRRSKYDIDDILLDSRNECIELEKELLGRIRHFDRCSVADLWDALELSSEFTDNKYGWYDLEDRITYTKVRDNGEIKWWFKLPKPERLD